jgi:twitching motility two-component system response regulator PilH
MDLVIPNSKGTPATRRLSKDPEPLNIPIIIVSSKNQETDKLWGFRQGAKGYICKPVNEDQLLTEINTLISTPTATS